MSPLRELLVQTLNQDIAPLLEADGGGLEIIEVDETRREVILRFTGAHAVCPGTRVLREDLIEPLLKKRLGDASFKYQR